MSRSLYAAYEAYGAAAEAAYVAIEAVYAAIDRRDLAAAHIALADARIALGAEAKCDDTYDLAYHAAREVAVSAAKAAATYHCVDYYYWCYYDDYCYDYGYYCYDYHAVAAWEESRSEYAKAAYVAITAVYAAIDRRDLAGVHFALADARIALGDEAKYDDAYHAAKEVAVSAAKAAATTTMTYSYDDYYDYEAEAAWAEAVEDARTEYHDGTPDGFEAAYGSDFYDYFGYHNYD